MPPLGITRDVKIEEWLQYEAAGTDGVTEFVGITESLSTWRTSVESRFGLTVCCRQSYKEQEAQ